MTAASALCVFCGSSNGARNEFGRDAIRLGRILADAGIRLIYGGGSIGLMGSAANAALASGGRVTGVVPRHILDLEVGHTSLTELIVVRSMHDRKLRMFELADAFAVLPGGIGTLDEALEIISWRLLGLHDKPILLVDSLGYWKPLVELINHTIECGFSKPRAARLYTVVSDVDEVLPALKSATAPATESRKELF